MNDSLIPLSPTRVKPDYTGGSILNLVATIAQHCGIDTGHRPLMPPLPIDDVKSVVLLIVDALGEHQLQHHLTTGDLPLLEQLLARDEATLTRLTSTFPSTTSAALTTLHTARAPAEHGLLGFTIWLPDQGTIAQALLFRDLLTRQPLADPRQLMAVPSLYQQLASGGVSSSVVIPANINGSQLSQWHFAGARRLPYPALAQIPGLVIDALAGHQSTYVVAYWPDYDTACHRHGPTSSEAGRTIRTFDAALGALLAKLPGGGNTLVLLSRSRATRARSGGGGRAQR